MNVDASARYGQQVGSIQQGRRVADLKVSGERCSGNGWGTGGGCALTAACVGEQQTLVGALLAPFELTHSAVALALMYAVCRACEWVVRELLGLVLFCAAGACLWLLRAGLVAPAGAGGGLGGLPRGFWSPARLVLPLAVCTGLGGENNRQGLFIVFGVF